jgi:hypothetical protein
MAFDFLLNLTGTFAAQLGPVVKGLAEAAPAMERVVVQADYLDESMKKIASSTRHTNLVLADHMKIGKAFSDFASSATQASLSVEQHAAIGQSLGQMFGDLGKQHEVGAALGQFFGDLGKMAEASKSHAKGLTLEWGNAFHSFAGFRRDAEGGWTFNVAEGLGAIAEGARGAAEFVTQLAERAYDLAKEMVGVVARTQDMRLALKLNLGEEGAEAVDHLAESIARTTRFSAGSIRQALLPLTEAGVKDEKTLDNLTTAAIDIATRRGQGMEGVQSALESFTRIAIRGEVNPKLLTGLAINATAYYEDLGKLLGRTGKQAEQLVKGGKVAKETLLSVALNQISMREGGNGIGSAALEGAKTLGATLQRLRDLPENLFEKLATSGGMIRIEETLDKFIDFATGPVGQEITKNIGNAFADLAQSILGDETSLKNFAATVQEAIPAIKTALEDLILVAKAAAGALHVAAKIVEPFIPRTADEKKAYIAQKEDELYANEHGGRHKITKDLVAGLNAARSDYVAAGESAGQGYTDGFASYTEIRSPSKMFRRFGGYSAEGFALGMEDGTSRVEAAARRSLIEPTFGGGGGAGARGGNVGPVSVNVVVNAAGESAEALAATVEQATQRALRRVLTEAGMQLPAAA